MRYGYARVSTRGQETDGNSLESQERLLKEAGADVVYSEAFTGTKADRPRLSELLGKLQEGDTLIITKLDRFARTASQGMEMIQALLDRGVAVHVLNMGLMDNTPTGKLIRSVMLAFAEFERDMIVERTSEGKAIARQNPEYREGRKPKEVDEGEYRRLRECVVAGQLTVMQACKELGIGRTKWYSMLKE